MHCPLRKASVFGLTLIALATASQGDEFVLVTGARIRGEWLNRRDRSADRHVVQTEHGGQISLSRDQVCKIRRQADAEREYSQIAPAVPDTVESQWKLAEWCRQHKLKQRRKHHLQRIIELDPEHVKARRALGYSEIGGQWVLQADYLRQQGYVRYKGEWQLPQEVELTKKRRELERAKKQWYAKIKRWRSQFDGDDARDAFQKVAAVRDPLAVEAVGRLLKEESDRRVRLLYIDVLCQIEGTASTKALVHQALNHPDEEVFFSCIDGVVPRTTPEVIRQFVNHLKSSDSARVNRAAHALGRLGDQSVIGPLIDALVTVHVQVIPGDGATKTTFISGPSQATPAMVRPGQAVMMAPRNGFNMSSGGDRVIRRQSRNQEVLKSLVKLTGVSFSFDQQAWRNWQTLHQREQRADSVNTRRGT